MRIILRRGIRMQKIHNPGWTFSRIFTVMPGPKTNLHPRMKNSSIASLTPKQSILSQTKIKFSDKITISVSFAEYLLLIVLYVYPSGHKTYQTYIRHSEDG